MIPTFKFNWTIIRILSYPKFDLDSSSIETVSRRSTEMHTPELHHILLVLRNVRIPMQYHSISTRINEPLHFGRVQNLDLSYYLHGLVLLQCRTQIILINALLPLTKSTSNFLFVLNIALNIVRPSTSLFDLFMKLFRTAVLLNSQFGSERCTCYFWVIDLVHLNLV